MVVESFPISFWVVVNCYQLLSIASKSQVQYAQSLVCNAWMGLLTFLPLFQFTLIFVKGIKEPNLKSSRICTEVFAVPGIRSCKSAPVNTPGNSLRNSFFAFTYLMLRWHRHAVRPYKIFVSPIATNGTKGFPLLQSILRWRSTLHAKLSLFLRSTHDITIHDSPWHAVSL